MVSYNAILYVKITTYNVQYENMLPKNDFSSKNNFTKVVKKLPIIKFLSSNTYYIIKIDINIFLKLS